MSTSAPASIPGDSIALLKQIEDHQKAIKELKTKENKNENHLPTLKNLDSSKSWNIALIAGSAILTAAGITLTGIAIGTGAAPVAIAALAVLTALTTGAVAYSVYRHYQLGTQHELLQGKEMETLQETKRKKYGEELVKKAQDLIPSQETELNTLKSKIASLEEEKSKLTSAQSTTKNTDPNPTPVKGNTDWGKTALKAGAAVLSLLGLACAIYRTVGI